MKYHYYMFHKPYGCVSARKDDTFPTVMDYFKELNQPDLSPVGRLDRETEGLLFITDDGCWNQKMTHPSFEKEKVYEFIALGDPTPERIANLEQGVLLKGSQIATRPCRIQVDRTSTLKEIMPDLPEEVQKASAHNHPEHPAFYGRITIKEGRKRQIRRMFKTQRCLILYLKRVEVDGIPLDPNLKAGQWKVFYPENYKIDKNVK